MSETPVKTYVYFVSFFAVSHLRKGFSFGNGFFKLNSPIDNDTAIQKIERMAGDLGVATARIISFQLVQTLEEDEETPDDSLSNLEQGGVVFPLTADKSEVRKGK